MDKSLVNEKRYVLTEILGEIPLESEVNSKRAKPLNDVQYKGGTVVYWMNRDKRVCDNWALLFAQEVAFKHNQKLVVVFKFDKQYTKRRFDFLLAGIKEIEDSLTEKNIPLLICDDIEKALVQLDAGILVRDFDPLCKEDLSVDIPQYLVDAHNICPVWAVSGKKEYAARTIRPKIKRIIADYVSEFPEIKKMPKCDFFDNDYVVPEIDKSVDSTRFIGGEKKALKMLDEFMNERLDVYDELRNDPTKDAQSNLSPYLTFGFISAQRLALEVLKSNASKQNKEAFLEELVVRKELSDNFCLYAQNYDLRECDNWAVDSLKEHESDYRPYLYSREEFESAKTHDELWNAAQIQMVKTGKMHGYMRMYWAKKILEWSKNAQEAFDVAMYLNDKYELDGCCPNAYVGVLWSIGGLHDRAWGSREIFGKIRYMSYQGCKSKFDITKYVRMQA